MHRVTCANEQQDIRDTVRKFVEDFARFRLQAAFHGHEAIEQIAEQTQLDADSCDDKERRVEAGAPPAGGEKGGRTETADYRARDRNLVGREAEPNETKGELPRPFLLARFKGPS